MVAKSDRKSEIRDTLQNRELSIARFTSLAFQQEEIKQIDIFKYEPGSTTRYGKVYQIGQGFDPDRVEDEILEKCKTGTFRFSVLGIDGVYIVHRIWSLGDLSTVAPTGMGGSSIRVEDTNTRKVLTDALKEAMETEQVEGFIANRETAKVNREMAPIKAVAELLSVLKAGGGGDSGELVKYLMAQNTETQRLLLEVLKGAGQRPAGDPLKESISTLDQVVGIAKSLGFTRGEGEGSGLWTPEGIAAILSHAAPLLREGFDTLKLAIGSRGVSTVPAAGNPPIPLPAPGGGEAVASMKPEDRELVEIGVNALKSKDWPTFLATYEAVRPMTMGVLPELNPEVNPALYIAVLKRFDVRFDLLRSELAAFLEWLREQEAETDAKRDTPPE